LQVARICASVEIVKEINATEPEMRAKLKFTQAADASSWPALPKRFAPGDVVYRFSGHTYGLDRDDAMYAGRETIPCSLTEASESFFTVPVEMLSDEQGHAVRGDYIFGLRTKA
jgi:hypothetical protein